MAKQNSLGVPLLLGSAKRHRARLARTLMPMLLLTAFISLVGCDRGGSHVERAKLNSHHVASVADPSAVLEIEGLGTVTNAGKSLTIRWRKIDRELLNSLRQYGSLTELRILGVDRQGESLIEHIAALEQLEILAIVEIKLSDDELKMLASLNKLRRLELAQTGINGSGLQSLASLPIQQLTLRESAVSVTGMRSLAMFTELESVELVLPNFHLSALPSLAGLSKLESVCIGKGFYSYREHGGLNCLVGAHSIRKLQLAGWNLNDRSLRVVGTLENLKELEIGESQVSFRGLQHLAGLTELEALSVLSGETRAVPEPIALRARGLGVAQGNDFTKYSPLRP